MASALRLKDFDLDLPDEVEILVPVFLDADQFPVKTAGALNNYYRSLNATLETMAPLADLPELPAVGTPLAWPSLSVIDNPLQPWTCSRTT